MAVIRFKEKTPEEVLEEAAATSDALIIYQCPKTGKCYESWTAYMWGSIRANDAAAGRNKRLKAQKS